MKKHIYAAVFACLAVPATAQDILADYFTMIGPQDMVNSSGQRLGDFCAIVQQDRANYHRFGKRDELDNSDPYFADRGTRALISTNCTIWPGQEYVRDAVLRGQPKYIWVQIRGSGGTISEIRVGEGAG